MTRALRERVALALYADQPATDTSHAVIPFDDAPPHYRALAYQQADIALTAIAPQQHEIASLADVLEGLLYERGNDARRWPPDEAAAYRELGWEEGIAAARRVMFEKAAAALLAPQVVSA